MLRAVRLMLPAFCLLALPVQAAVFPVTKTADTLDGACDRDCSLREAIAAANANLLGDADVVVVPAGIYRLTRIGAGEEDNATGDLDVRGSTILVGTGAGSTVIDGYGSDRVLDLRGPAEIEGVTIRNGRADGDGGGVLVRPDPVRWPVLVHRSVISGNRAQGDGGGISAPAIGEWADVEIRESAILENQAGGDGGGFAGIGFQLENVTVSDNRAEGSGGGLAYEAGQGETISSATIVFNQAGVSGGGIHAGAPLFPGTFSPQVSASIVADNFAPQGRDCSGLPVSLGYNVLGVGEGCSPQATDRAGTAGHPLSAVFRVQDTRLGPTPVHTLLLNSPASNLVPYTHCEDADQLGQERFEVACDAGALEQSLVPRCLPGGSVLCLAGIRVTATLDERFPSRGAQAVPLTGNTGYFWFFSPDNLEIQVKVLNGCAVNGHLWFFASGLTDVGVHLQAVDPKTGRTRTYVHKAGTTFPPRLDTSAFPCPEPPGPGVGDNAILKLRSGEVFRVTRASDGHEDGSCDFDCSLREAMTAANARPTTSVIVLGQGLFHLNIPGRDEDLGQVGDLDVTAPLVILGAGANRTVIDGGGNDRVLDVHDTGSLELHDATVRNGRVPEGSLDTLGHGGGGIRSYGPLALVRSWVTANSAGHEGGGVAAHGEIEVRDSTISGNFAGKFGGGLFAAGGGLLENVTLSGNEAGQTGGGALLFGTEPPALDSVTITGNLALDAGGLSVEGGCDFACVIGLTMRRTVIAGNTATLNRPDCIASVDHVGAQNLFGIGVGCNPSPGDLSGTPEQPLDPRLTPLGDHGGPTPTHALLPDSPAIDLAPAASCPSSDQRGRPRPADGDGDGQALCDAGAVERLPGCQPDEETLCLGENDRFRVTARWTVQGATGPSTGPGKAVPLAALTGSFWFFDAANLEITVKVLDGCGLNDRFWVFLSGLTDVGVEVTVEDTATGNTWTHEHAAGTPLQPRLDTEALPCASF